MAGSDTIIPGLVPGFALHRELKELVGVGLTPYEALRTATTRPFEYLGEIDQAGRLKLANTPTWSLWTRTLSRIYPVLQRFQECSIRGRWIGTDEIKKRMKEIETSFQAPSDARTSRQ